MLNLRRYEYLCSIAGLGWLKIATVMDRIGSNRFAAHQMVRDLVADGYIERRRREMEIEVRVTAKGGTAIKRFHRHINDLYETIP